MAARTRALTETAALTALAALLFLVAQIPVIGTPLCLGCPFPITLVFYRHGARSGLAGLGVLAVLLVVTQGAYAALALPFVWIGALLGLLLRSGRTPLETLAVGSLGLGALLFVGAWGYENLLAEQLGTTTFRELLEASVEEAHGKLVTTLADRYGLSVAEFKKGQIHSALLEGRRFMRLLARAFSWMPLAVMGFMGSLAFFLYQVAARPLLGRLGVEVDPLPPFSDWRAPWWLAWGVIGLATAELVPGVVAAVEPHPEVPYLRFAVMNLWVLAGAFYALMGAAVADELLRRLGFPWLLARFFEGIWFLTPLPGGLFGMHVLALVGLLDPWLRLRERVPEDLSGGRRGGGGDGAARRGGEGGAGGGARDGEDGERPEDEKRHGHEPPAHRILRRSSGRPAHPGVYLE